MGQRSQCRLQADPECVICTDALAANFSAERLLQEHNEKEFPDTDFGRLHVSCDVHKVHGIAKATLKQFDYFTSGLLKSALYLRAGGLPAFRTAFKQVVRQRIKIYYGEPMAFGVDPAAQRTFFLQTFFGESLHDEGLQLLNGNWMDTGAESGIIKQVEYLYHNTITINWMGTG